MKLKTFTLAVAALASSFAMTLPASAQEASKWPEHMAGRVTWDKDGMVTRQAYMEAMGKHWDEHHAAMMKMDPKMKPGLMDRNQFLTYQKRMVDPGKVGG
jgi:hypothetical protein